MRIHFDLCPSTLSCDPPAPPIASVRVCYATRVRMLSSHACHRRQLASPRGVSRSSQPDSARCSGNTTDREDAELGFGGRTACLPCLVGFPAVPAPDT